MADRVVTGSFVASGSSGHIAPLDTTRRRGPAAFNFSLWGTFVADLILERSFDDGLTWLPLTALGNSIVFTAPCSEIFEESEDGVYYRVRCDGISSGQVNYRLSF